MTTHSPQRRHLPVERAAIVHRFMVGGFEGYITIGLFPDGQPAETFITMSKEGSNLSGLMDTLAISWSLALQYGVPLAALVNKLKDLSFEPSGVTGNPDIPSARSISDYIGRWLELKFLRVVVKDAFTAGRPVSEYDPPPLPHETGDIDPVMEQAAGIISTLTAPIDPTKNGTGDLPGSEEK